MEKIKREKKQLDAYQKYQRELLWKKVGKVCLKCLIVAGIALFSIVFFFFYFAKICIDKK